MKASDVTKVFIEARQSIINALTDYVVDKGGEVALQYADDKHYFVECDSNVVTEKFKRLYIENGVCMVEYTVSTGWEDDEEEVVNEELGVFLSVDELYHIIRRLEKW